MNLRNLYFFLTTFALFVFISGCSGKGQLPITPPINDSDNVADQNSMPDDNQASGILGIYEIAVNTATMEYEIQPARDLSLIGDTAVPDITQYFISTPCADCFGISAVGLTSDSYLDLVFKMKHPFPSDITRRDLNVFDVRGIMILSGSQEFTSLPFIDINGDGFVDEAPKGNFTRVVNADAYTYHYDDVALDKYGYNMEGNLNPYKRFFTENNPDPDIDGMAIPWHKMAQGSPFDKKHYILKIDQSGETIEFVFVIECAYGQSALFGIPPGEPGSRDNPLYFNPEFNQKEAYSVAVDPIENIVAENTSASTTVTIYVQDWQNSQAPGWNINDPSSIKYRSDVASVTLSIPEISSTLYNKTNPDSGNGTKQNPYVFAFEVTNDQGAMEGEYTGLIAIMDEFQDDGRTVFGSTTSIKFTNFTCYKPVIIIAEPGFINNDPVAVGSADPNPADNGQTVNFIDADSHDDDAGDSIVEYAWDFDYTSVFEADATNSTSNQASHAYTNNTGSDVQFTARLRVKDTHNAIGYTDVVVTVHSSENSPPVAEADATPNPAGHNQTVNLKDAGSHDNDPGDSIAQYAWDYNWDGIPANFNVDTSSTFPNQASTSYQNTSGSDIQVTAGLRVKDTHDIYGYDSVIITVHTEVTNNNPPIARANANPNPVTSGREVALIDILSEDLDPGDYIAIYKWDVDIYDGVNWTAPDYEATTPNSVHHIYYNTGLDPVQYTARLRVYDSHGAWNDDDITITINPNKLPIAVCDADPNPTRGGMQVQLIDVDSYDQDPTGRIVLYEWDIDYDGAAFDIDYSSNQSNHAVHTYENSTDNPIIYTAALRVTDNALTTDICTVDITVDPNHPPIADGYVTPDPQYAGYDVTFHAQNSHDNDPGDSITKIEWDFDWDGIPANFTVDWSSSNKSDTTTHIYDNSTPSQIIKTAGLRVFDQANVTNIDSVTVHVDPEIPEPIITHAENKAYRTVGKQYLYQALNFNSTLWSWTNGPWDFTTLSHGSSYLEQFVNPATDPDFEPFRSDYPLATGVFKAADTVNGGYALAPYTLEDISPPLSGNQVEMGQENSIWTDVGMHFENPVDIPFPMQMGYYESKVASGTIADVQAFTITFLIQSVGYGLCKTDYGTQVALLVRNYTVVSYPGSGLEDSKYVSYEWIGDDGKKLATVSTQNFDPSTYLPIGMIKGGQLYQINN
jgi:hypothetical protein